MSNGIYLKLFVDCLEKYQKLNDTEFGRLVRASLRYKATGAEPTDLGREALLWDGMRLDIDRDNEKYNETLESRSEAGKKGAQARWQKNSKNGKCHLPYGKNGQDKDKDKDEDKDEDKDKKIPPKSPQGERDIFEGRNFSDEMKAELEKWLQYKKERRELYKPTGLKSFLSGVENRLKEYAEEDVIALIEDCMSSNWQGIIWDRLKRKKPKQEPERSPSSASEFTPPSPEMDEHRVLIDPEKPFDLMELLP